MNECNHGQLARSCRECELEAEIAALRAQVADKDCAVAMLAAQTRAKLELLGKVMELEAQLADCRAEIEALRSKEGKGE